jgi:hypothetical protein
VNDKQYDKYKSRTLYITAYCLILITIGLFTKFLNGAETISGITIVLGVWAGTDAYNKRTFKEKGD